MKKGERERGFWKKMADEFKEGFDIGKRIVQINNKMQKAGTTAVLTDEERQFYLANEKMSPEEYLAKYQEKQARIAEKQRISALKQQETQYHIGGLNFRRGGNGLYYFGDVFVGALSGTHRHTDLKTTVQQVEKDTVAYLVFESVRTGERVQKQIRCNTKIAGQVGKLMG